MMEGNMIKSPFKFLDSYSASDKDIFFGRDREIEEIYSKVFQSKLLLVYGASGTGKSSIINCGLANKLSTYDWLPIQIRRGGNIMKSMYNMVQKEAVSEIPNPNESIGHKELHHAISSVFLDHFKPIYLIFDQFEELFIFGFKDEWKEFIAAIRHLMDSDLDVHFIFVIRGEYLEFLSEFEELIPEFFDNRMRIEKMTRNNAVESIIGPSKLFPIDIEEGFEDKLLKKLSPEKSQIELTFLQVFLDKIYKNALERQEQNKNLQFTNEEVEKLGQIGDVLAEFVDEQLFKMADPRAALTILKSFVSLQGTKNQRTSSEVKQYTSDIGNPIDQANIDNILVDFVNKRILKDHDENGKYELRHDSLAQKIFEKITIQERELLDVKQFLSYSYNEYDKRGTLLNDEDLTYIAPHERNLELEDEILDFIEESRRNSSKRKKQQRTRSIIISVIVILMITSIIGFIYSQQQKARAEQLALVAQQESQEAQRQRQIAEEQSVLATQKGEEANIQAEIAREQRELAEISRDEAEQQRAMAIAQKTIAEREREVANEERIRAEKSEVEARNQQQIAEEQRQIALRLRMLSLAREMSVKSTHMLDKNLKALLALQASQFNSKYGGNQFQSEIYGALYLAKRTLIENEFVVSDSHSQAIKSIISRQGGIYTAGNDGKVIKISTNKEAVEKSVLHSSIEAIETMDLSMDERLLAFGTQQGVLVLIDNFSNQILNKLDIHQTEIVNVIIMKDQVVTMDRDGNVILTDFEGNRVGQIDIGRELVSAGNHRNSLFLATRDGSIISMDSDLNIKNEFQPYEAKGISNIEVDNIGRVMAIGFEHGEIMVWDMGDNKPIQVLPGHTAAITDLAFDQKNEFLVSGSFDRSVRLWKLDELENQPVSIQDNDTWVSAVAFDDVNGHFHSGTFNGIHRKFPKSTINLTKGMCEKIERQMTVEEWSEFIATDIPFEDTCNND